MVVGSTLSDVIAVNTPTEQDLKEEKAAGNDWDSYMLTLRVASNFAEIVKLFLL